jgi:hypothetical protein
MLKKGASYFVCLSLVAILFLCVAEIPTVRADTQPQPFGPSLSVTDPAGDVVEWVEFPNGSFAWGPAPSWASYCDITQVNASHNDQNYSIAVVLASAANMSRYQTGYAGIHVFINFTTLANANGTLQLLLGGELYSSGEVLGHLSYAQLQNYTDTTQTFNVTDIAQITGNIVNFSFPISIFANEPDLQGQILPLEDWEVQVWSWDFFNSTSAFQSGDLFWDGYGDPTFEQEWSAGTYTFPTIGGYDIFLIVAAISVGVAVLVVSINSKQKKDRDGGFTP